MCHANTSTHTVTYEHIQAHICSHAQFMEDMESLCHLPPHPNVAKEVGHTPWKYTL